jgi:hypothetical protein
MALPVSCPAGFDIVWAGGDSSWQPVEINIVKVTTIKRDRKRMVFSL